MDNLVKFWLTEVLFKAQVTVEELSDLDVLVPDMVAKGVVCEGTMNNEVLVTSVSISDDAFMVGLDMVDDSTLEASDIFCWFASSLSQRWYNFCFVGFL